MEEIRYVDEQGRVVLPKRWRERYLQTRRVVVREEGESLVIVPYRPPDLTKLFDSIEVDLKSDLSDWESVRRELLEAGRRQRLRSRVPEA